MNTPEPIYSYRITRKVRIGGSGCLSALCYLVGFVLLLSFSLLSVVGIFFLVIAFAVDTKTTRVSTCGHCGNELSHHSVLCPTCGADLAPEPLLKRLMR